MKNKLEETVRNVIREFAKELNAAPTIEITPNEQDPRSPKQGETSYHVNYQKEINGELIEIEGDMKPFHTGRSIEYGFEPGYFTDQVAENYWDQNWEAIEDEIREKFYGIKY